MRIIISIRKIIVTISVIVFSCFNFLYAQQKENSVKIIDVKDEQKVIITIDDKPFTVFVYSDTLTKPVLYPIYAADGQLITRGYPISPRANEPTDHPHHTGLWFNYENVNGLDFWNNSFAIPAEKKNLYGWIRTDSILEIQSGNKGILKYRAYWQDQQRNNLLKEITTFIFTANKNTRIIDRITTLTAQQDILFSDAKDGLLGLRVAHELELPSKEEREFTDIHGNVTKVIGNNNSTVTGNYITSEGKEGDSAWGTRGVWCMLFGKLKNDTISIAIIDHPDNPGYPTYWHARGYGLFAANPLGQKVFSNGKEELNFNLKKGASATFRYRIVINSSAQRLTADELSELSNSFARFK